MKSHGDEARLVRLAQEFYLSGFGRNSSFHERPGSIMRSAEGNYATDISGNRLFDTESCASACYLGFGLPEVMDALRDEMARMPSTTPLFVPTPPHRKMEVYLDTITSYGVI